MIQRYKPVTFHGMYDNDVGGYVRYEDYVKELNKYKPTEKDPFSVKYEHPSAKGYIMKYASNYGEMLRLVNDLRKVDGISNIRVFAMTELDIMETVVINVKPPE